MIEPRAADQRRHRRRQDAVGLEEAGLSGRKLLEMPGAQHQDGGAARGFQSVELVLGGSFRAGAIDHDRGAVQQAGDQRGVAGKRGEIPRDLIAAEAIEHAGMDARKTGVQHRIENRGDVGARRLPDGERSKLAHGDDPLPDAKGPGMLVPGPVLVRAW